MPKMKFFAASIVVDGEDVVEIEDPDAPEDGPESRSQTRYIEAREGQEFGIKLVVKDGRLIEDCNALECKYILDGQERHDTILEKDDELRDRSYECVCDASTFKRNGQWLEQEFRFAKLQLGMSAKWYLISTLTKTRRRSLARPFRLHLR